MNDRAAREVTVFNEALALSASERDAYLNEACRDDPALRSRVASLLAAHRAAGGFLQEPPAGASRLASSEEKSGDRIGRYKLLEQIGEGGCGVV
jgi:eukaryotic-like serine/threonine-protein kinase